MDLLELLSADHHNLEGVKTPGLVKAALEHIWVERELLHPAIHEYVDGGGAIVDGMLSLDDRLEDRLAEFEEATGAETEQTGEASREAAVEAEAEVRSVISEHIGMQEELFPTLRESIPPERLVELAEGVPLAIGGAPTRPHAGRSEGFLGEIAEDLTAAADHLRDMFHRRERD